MPQVTYVTAEILDYVETHAPPEEESFGISQRELAKALGYHPCSMSRPLADLVSNGYLRTHRGLVRGGQRKQFVYRLTEEGRDHLRGQTRDVPMLSGAIPPPPNPFLGRKKELQELLSYSQEGGAVVFVEGTAGMGKSALIARHIRRIKAGRVPFWFTVRSGSSSRHFTIALARAMSSIGAQQLAYYSQLPRQPVGREVADLASRALGTRPFLMVVDDVQVASPDMRKFLDDFLRGLGPGRHDLFFLVGQVPPIFEPAGLSSYHLTLGGLDRASAHDLTDRRGGLADRFESVYQASLGSPLLLQLAVTTPNVEATASALPAAVVERLPLEELIGLIPIALANEPIPISFVVENAGIASTRLDQLVQIGLLQKTHQGRVEVLQVVRGALLTKVGPLEERAGHLTLAAYYGRSHRPESVRERFLHLVSAEAWRLSTHLLDKQERTLLSLGYSDQLRNALRHLTLAMPRGKGRVLALRVEATLLRLHSEFSEAILSLRRAISEAEGDSRFQAECVCQIVELCVRLGQLEEADRELATARTMGPFTRRLEVFLMLSEARIIDARGDYPKAQALYLQILERARRHRIPDLALESIAAWSRIASIGGEYEAALRVVEQGLPDARQSGRLDIVFNLLLVRARAYAEMGQRDQAEAEMRSIRSEAESLGYLNQLAYVLSGLAAMAAERERWPEVVQYARQASTLAERLGNDLVLGHTLGVLASGERRQGLLEDARGHGERAVSILGRLAPSDSLMLAHCYLAEVYYDFGRADTARTHWEAAIGLADKLGLPWWRKRIENEMKHEARSA
ncbi:MAG TPA: AAA family ATPase [Thermoplasmata archaeon]|nr:AAA family ATPase [Thermoplasmata archaeon]